MILNQSMLKEIAKDVNSVERKEFRTQDFKRWLMFNGKTLEIVKEAISKEFSKPETIEELSSRIVPINIVTKIITKLATIYTEDPERKSKDGNTDDTDLMDMWTEEGCLNQSMKEANRYFKLFKRNLMEIFVDDAGLPHFRNLPRHSYEVFSMDMQVPNRADVVVKIVRDAREESDQILAIWTKDSFWVTDGKGNVNFLKMNQMENPEGVNPFGALPFVYINESTSSVDPLPDDDLMRVAITIPVVLTDLVMATKFQTFSLIWTIGDVGDVPSNPNSVIPLQWGPDGQKPEIGTVKPEVDTDKVLALISQTLAMLLSTKNLSAPTIGGTLTVESAQSGVAKMIDQAESVEDKKDQQAFFQKAEQDLWWFIKEHGIPFWRAKNMLTDDLNREFSNDFEPIIFFREPEVFLSDKERIELSRLKIDAGFSTVKRELGALNPQMRDDELEDLIAEIEEERASASSFVIDSINGSDGGDDADREGDD